MSARPRTRIVMSATTFSVTSSIGELTGTQHLRPPPDYSDRYRDRRQDGPVMQALTDCSKFLCKLHDVKRNKRSAAVAA